MSHFTPSFLEGTSVRDAAVRDVKRRARHSYAGAIVDVLVTVLYVVFFSSVGMLVLWVCNVVFEVWLLLRWHSAIEHLKRVDEVFRRARDQ